MLPVMRTILLWIVFLSSIPTIGYAQFYQVLPETCNVEQVFTPFSRIESTHNFHFNLYPENQEISENPVYTDFQFILNAVNHSVTVVFQVQRIVVHSVEGVTISPRIIRYSSEYKEDDDVRI